MARARLQAVNARIVVLTVLKGIAEKTDNGPIVKPIVRFSKTEFVRTYWELRRQGKVPPIKQETLLRTLRHLAANPSILYVNYEEKTKGKYVLDIGALP